jgi:hypothetical protein
LEAVEEEELAAGRLLNLEGMLAWLEEEEEMSRATCPM